MRIAILLLCCTAAVAQPPASEESRNERWREDIRVLSQRLSENHPNFFNTVGREAFQAAVDSLLGAVPEKADHQITVEMARIAALGQDAHTNLSLTQAAAGFRLFPLRVYRFSDGWHVTSASEPRAIGARVLAIGGMPIDDVVDRVRPVVSHENESWLSSQAAALLVSPEVLHAVGVAGELGSATYLLRATGGQEFPFDARAGSAAVYTIHPAQPVNPWYQRNANLNYWFTYLPESRTIYLKYNVCRESPMLPIAEFARKIAEVANQNPVERLIVDVRNNGGGDSSVFNRLSAELQRVQALFPAVLSGKVYGITGRGTFSSGIIAAMDVRANGFKLIGEPTGGRPNWYGEVIGFALPNSRLMVSLSTRLVTSATEKGTTVSPDVPVDFTIADYLAERDPYLEAALRQ